MSFESSTIKNEERNPNSQELESDISGIIDKVAKRDPTVEGYSDPSTTRELPPMTDIEYKIFQKAKETEPLKASDEIVQDLIKQGLLDDREGSREKQEEREEVGV